MKVDKIKIFDIGTYNENLDKLSKRNAPKYLIEAYKHGFTNEVNTYYENRYKKILNKDTKRSKQEFHIYKQLAEDSGIKFLNEAIKKEDLEFIKMFFQMTNLDIFKGERIPKEAGLMLLPQHIKSSGLKDLYKKMR